MKKIAFFLFIVALFVSYQTNVCGMNDWLSQFSRANFTNKATEDSRVQRDEVIDASVVKNKKDIISEANVIANTVVLSGEITVTPSYEIRRILKKKSFIKKLDQTFDLEGNNPIFRELLAHEVAEDLAKNEGIADMYDEDTEIRLVGCRITWSYADRTYYLVDNDLDGHWDVAGKGDVSFNRAYGINEVDVSKEKKVTQKSVHKMY